MEKNGTNIQDKEFHHCREVLTAKRNHGNKRRKADPFSSDDIDLLFQRKLLGTGNPEALLNTVWLNKTLHFGMRGRKEHVDMLIGDVKMMTTTTGEQYLEYNERLTKTRTGQGDSRPFARKMFAAPGNPRCPVSAFKEYIRTRPADTLTPECRFYLGINRGIQPDANNETVKQTWFIKQALGKNTLGDLAKTMSMKGGLSGRKVNHSGRKTTVTSLLHSNVEATTVMQLTGHKNVASVNGYSSASFNQQQQMSNILTDIGTGSRGLIPQETNTSRSVNNSTPHIDIYEDQSEFPNDDYIFNNIDLDNVVQTIENFESNIGEKMSKLTVETALNFQFCHMHPLVT